MIENVPLAQTSACLPSLLDNFPHMSPTCRCYHYYCAIKWRSKASPAWTGFGQRALSMLTFKELCTRRGIFSSSTVYTRSITKSVTHLNVSPCSPQFVIYLPLMIFLMTGTSFQLPGLLADVPSSANGSLPPSSRAPAI